MKGYTLIELLVTVTILVLVTGGSMAAYLTFNENRNLDIDAKNLNTLINKIRSKAVFLEYPLNCTGLQNYQLDSELDSEGRRTAVRFFANCNSGPSTEIHQEILSSSAMIADLNLVFLPITGNLNPLEDEEITLQTINGRLKTKKLVINKFLGTNNVINVEQ
jgi:prepilin-type N-terminal cleavage/methylation domain-containing protein